MTTLRLIGYGLLRAGVILAITGRSVLCAWTPGTYPVGSYNFTVDTQVRNDVVAFWQGVYQASEGYQDRIVWTGDYAAAAPNYDGQGTTAAAFVTDVERRLNFYRALCNIPAGARVNTGATVLINAADPTNLYHPGSTPSLAAATTKAEAAQRSAYMIIRTYEVGNSNAALYHEPIQAQCVAWTTAAWNANHHGNLSLGHYGPWAIDAYMAEDIAGTSNDNINVGHRRTLSRPVSTDYATGDTPGSYDPATSVIRQPTNVTYVAPKTSEQVAVSPRMVPYPPAGFFPVPLNPTKYWSLSYPGADFTAATVAMTTANGATVPVTIVSRTASYGDPAIVWQISGTVAAVKTVTADTTFNVTVATIKGTGVPTSHSYAVTLINPNLITSDQALLGPTVPAIGTPPLYQFTPPPKAEALQVNCFQPLTTAWSEGAEDAPAAQVTASTSGTYEFRSSEVYAANPGYWTAIGPLTGAKSFRLSIPAQYDVRVGDIPEQSFEVTREILPGESASLNFNYRRLLMTQWTHLVVETTADDGATWTRLGSSIPGNTNFYPDADKISDSRTLAASSNPIRVRFRFFYEPNGDLGQWFFSHEKYSSWPTGILIDDISTTNCRWLELKKTNDLAATTTSFELNNTTAGLPLENHLELGLRLRTKLGNRWMPYGDMKSLAFSSASMTTTPQFSPASGVYPAGEALTLTSESGATIFYRVNGGSTLSAASPVTGLTVPAYPATLSLSAFAQKAGRSDSSIAAATYTALAPPTSTPIFSPPSGEYPAGQAITITGASGATIYYRVNGGTELSGVSPITGLTVPAYPATFSLSAYAAKTDYSNSGIATANYTSSPFKTWANSYFPGVTDAAISGPAADPDHDSLPNILEFGLGGNPSSGGPPAKLYPITNDGSATRKFLLTIAVRAGTPAFTGTPSPTATCDGITYAILGGLTPDQSNSPVSVVTPPQITGLAAAPAGYEYRSFKLDAADGLPSKGYLRVRVTTVP